MTLSRTLYQAIAFATLLIVATPARPDVYAFTDDQGVLTFTDTPRDPRARLVLVEPKPVVPPPAPNASAVPTPPEVGSVQEMIAAAAARHGVEPALVTAVIQAESGFNARAVSPKGAQGLMQLMPATAQRLGVTDVFNARQNIEGGVRYLADLMTLFKYDVRLALAAYNAGEQAVIRYGYRVPPYRETQAYVPRVLDYYRSFRNGNTRL